MRVCVCVRAAGAGDAARGGLGAAGGRGGGVLAVRRQPGHSPCSKHGLLADTMALIASDFLSNQVRRQPSAVLPREKTFPCIFPCCLAACHCLSLAASPPSTTFPLRPRRLSLPFHCVFTAFHCLSLNRRPPQQDDMTVVVVRLAETASWQVQETSFDAQPDGSEQEQELAGGAMSAASAVRVVYQTSKRRKV